jgi:hypothetical protein
MRNAISTFGSWFGLAAALIAIGGCNNSPVVPVSGKVVFLSRDQPKVCRLTFLPIEDASSGSVRAGGATMAADGTYSVTPYQGVEGLLPGRYKISVDYYDLKPGGNPNFEGDWLPQTHAAGELVIEPGSGAVEHVVEVP